MGYIGGFWGKAARGAAATPAWHPLGYHSLDVAAVAEAFLAANPAVATQVAGMLGTSAPEATRLVAFLAAIHDTGKFGMDFQSKVPALFTALFPGLPLACSASSHAAVGLGLALDILLDTWTDAAAESQLEAILVPLLSAACCHHGRPEQPVMTGVSALSRKAATGFIQEMCRIFGLETLPAALRASALARGDAATNLRRATHLLAGIINVADWVGSSEALFPYQPPGLDLDRYWAQARTRASAAIAAVNLQEKTGAPIAGFARLFGGRGLTPTPLQAYADTVALPFSPTLAILEDETGAGKTEAALTLASRMLRQYGHRGLFFSLPTQTTANAILERMLPVADRFFEPDAGPSLTLAHGNSKFALARLAARGAVGTVAADLQAWAQESAKTALLSDLGVGTIDQVVMAGIGVRHVAMRQMGLARKILIVDEVHACEPYLLELLRHALYFHAMMGGSAILMSATLPSQVKQSLVDAFSRGQGNGPAATLMNSAYPLATLCASGAVTETAVRARGAVHQVAMQAISPDAVPTLVHRMLEEGKCVCLMRNTVGAAQAAYDHYSARYPGQVALVHAKFALRHRVDNDQALLRQFGPDSVPATRTGQLVIATQVAEQSLDVDFDEMITELAPIDSLLQRFGRRKRHARRADGARAVAEGRAESPVYVVCPSPHSPSFLNEIDKGTRYVYPMAGVVYRTAQIIWEWGPLVLPHQYRDAVEFAYAQDASLPEVVAEAEDRWFGRLLAQDQQARQILLDFDQGYVVYAGVDGSEGAVTRLGALSRVVVLCDEGGTPLFNGEVESQLSVRKDLVCAEKIEEDGKVHLRLSSPCAGQWTTKLRSGKTLAYSLARGLSIG